MEHLFKLHCQEQYSSNILYETFLVPQLILLNIGPKVKTSLYFIMSHLTEDSLSIESLWNEWLTAFYDTIWRPEYHWNWEIIIIYKVLYAFLLYVNVFGQCLYLFIVQKKLFQLFFPSNVTYFKYAHLFIRVWRQATWLQNMYLCLLYTQLLLVI